MNTRSLHDAINLGRAERKHGLICFSVDDGWCQKTHRTVSEAHRCRVEQGTPERRTFSLDSVAAQVIEDSEQRLRDVLTYLDLRDEQQTAELPVLESA